MANDQYIKEYPSNKILGILRTESNGDIYAIAYPSYKRLGFYRPRTDMTYEYPSYRPVSKGNSVVQFIYQNKR